MATHEREIERINSEYLRRDTELPTDFYSLRYDSNFFSYTHLSRCFIRALNEANCFPLANKDLVDIGCGCGHWLLGFATWGADQTRLHGIDLSDDRANTARRRCPLAHISTGDARALPWPDEKFDIVTQFMAFMSILDFEMKAEIAREMLRVVKQKGVILWYDLRMDNPRNPQIGGIGSKEIRALFPNCEITLTPVTLAPPLTRRIARWSWTAAHLLEKIPWLCTHYMAVIRRSVGDTT